MTTYTIKLAQDFSPCPAGRYIENGPFSGTSFREGFLIPTIKDKSNDRIVVDFSGSEMAGSSFLEEAFGGLIREGISKDDLRNRLKIESHRQSDKTRV